jgi:hypothetical protein
VSITKTLKNSNLHLQVDLHNIRLYLLTYNSSTGNGCGLAHAADPRSKLGMVCITGFPGTKTTQSPDRLVSPSARHEYTTAPHKSLVVVVLQHHSRSGPLATASSPACGPVWDQNLLHHLLVGGTSAKCAHAGHHSSCEASVSVYAVYRCCNMPAAADLVGH